MFAVALADNARARLAISEGRDNIEDLVQRNSGNVKAAANLTSRQSRAPGGVEGFHDIDGTRESLLAGEFTSGHAHAPSFR